MKAEGKKLYIECLRILAAFFVLYNHNYAFDYYKEVEGTALYWIVLFMACFCKFSVSMFFMISGSLLLDRKEEFSIFLKKRVVKTVLIIFVFSLLQDIWEYRKTLEFDMVEFLKSLYKEPATNSYWFLYLYLAFMITLPFLRYIAVNMTKQEFYYIIVFALFFGLLPILKLFFSSDCLLNIDILDVNYFYPLIGYYIGKNIDCEKLNKKNHMLLAGIAFVSIVVSALLVALQKQKTGEYTETYLSLCIPYVCIWLFVLCKSFEKQFDRYKNIIVFMGRGTIGVFLLGNIIKECLWPIFEFLCNYIIRGVANFLFIILQLIVGILITNMFFMFVRFIRNKLKKRTKETILEGAET